MADDFAHPGPDEPKHETPSEGDFPADFFDDVDDPGPSQAHAHAPTHDAPEPLPKTIAPVNPPTAPAASPAPTPARPAPAHATTGASSHREPGRPRSSVFPIVVGVLLLGSLAGAWYVGRKQGQDSAETPGPSAPNPTTTTTETAKAPAHAGSTGSAAKSTDEAPTPTARNDADGEDVKAIKKQLADLADEHKALRKKVDAQPKPEPAADLKPIQAKLDELTKSVAAVTPLSEKIDTLEERVGRLDGAVKSVKEEVSGLSGEVKTLSAAPAHPKPAADANATANAAGEGADSGPTLAQGADLFKAGKYKEAEEVFKSLESGNPKDARVYYYAALAYGLSTGDWQGELLKKAAAKGAELEKAGSPKAQEIDSAFASLPETLKPWLAFFRKSAK